MWNDLPSIEGSNFVSSENVFRKRIESCTETTNLRACQFISSKGLTINLNIKQLRLKM